MSLVAVSIIYISLLLVGAFFLMSSVVNEMASSFESKVSIQVFLKDDAADTDVKALQAAIQAMPNVKSISYVTKDQALASFKERTKNRRSSSSSCATTRCRPPSRSRSSTRARSRALST